MTTDTERISHLESQVARMGALLEAYAKGTSGIITLDSVKLGAAAYLSPPPVAKECKHTRASLFGHDGYTPTGYRCEDCGATRDDVPDSKWDTPVAKGEEGWPRFTVIEKDGWLYRWNKDGTRNVWHAETNKWGWAAPRKQLDDVALTLSEVRERWPEAAKALESTNPKCPHCGHDLTTK